ncbi:regulatory protein RecX [Pelagerythrobacter aerophilus]|uniref:Regulatory protein RecX n=1 Tax=Pelagerythrobacter aerophilus TaxID=2306995 RepID=A0A418NEZ0_9SPHN|nr:RecX family transcriptional regulator [Pelagerythrobacter aerophilus]RIV76925.1 RecX family transcriptional regulator [Pelagerythrobacter aerophilus]
MVREGTHERRRRRPPKPLDEARLEELALAYVARFATTAAKLEGYLARKLRERGWEGERPADPAGIAARFAELGYIDDEAYARARAGGLLRSGYGARRIDQALRGAGIDEDLRAGAQPGERARREAALTLARKRRFGPFGGEVPERDRREKQLAAMIRAGHGFDDARAVMDAKDVAEAEQWVADAADDEEDR